MNEDFLTKFLTGLGSILIGLLMEATGHNIMMIILFTIGILQIAGINIDLLSFQNKGEKKWIKKVQIS